MGKEIIVSDESVNIYGFRVLTAGIDLSAYLKNPVMKWDHTMRYSDNKNVILPIGRMSHLHVNAQNQLIATPEFDSKDEFAAEIERKYNDGFINAASIGFPTVDNIEYSYDEEQMLPGQTGPTITKCRLREISLTDIGGNYNCVQLHHQGAMVELNSKTTPEDLKTLFPINKPIESMKKVIAELNATGLVSLPDSATEELVATGAKAVIGALSAKDQEIASLTKKNGELVAAATAAKADALKKNATVLVEGALSANKIVANQKESYVTLAATSEEGYESVKKIFEGMQPYKSASSQLNANTVELPASKEAKAQLFEKHMNEQTLATLSADTITELYTAANGKAPSAETLKKLTGK